MVKVTEQNVITKSGFKVVTTTRVVDDPGIRMSPRVLIHKKEVKLYQLKQDRNDVFKSIQYSQKLALITDDDYVARQKMEYVQLILIPELRHIDAEIHGLECEIAELRTRI